MLLEDIAAQRQRDLEWGADVLMEVYEDVDPHSRSLSSGLQSTRAKGPRMGGRRVMEVRGRRRPPRKSPFREGTCVHHTKKS